MVLAEATAAGEVRPQAEALTQLGAAEIAVGAYDAADETLGQALERWREVGDDAGGADVLRELGVSHLFRGDLVQAERFVSEALASYRSSGRERGGAWALQNLAWISFTGGDIKAAEERLQQSASAFAELGDWGGLSWAYGLLAFVRYNQGRNEEAAQLAEHIAVDGRETGNRWAVGMMNVLLANVRLWSGRMNESVARGGEAIALFQEIGDRWGEVMATGPVVRVARRARPRRRVRRHARALPHDQPRHARRGHADVPRGDGVARRPAAGPARSRAGDPRRRSTSTRPTTAASSGRPTAARRWGWRCSSSGRSTTRSTCSRAATPASAEDGPVMAIGCRLALAYAGRPTAPTTPTAVVADLQARAGGSFSDRMFALWAEAFVRTQRNAPDAREPADAAYALAVGTDAPLEHAIAALARATVLAALGTDDAEDAAEDATMQLEALGLTADGWLRIFDLALAGVSVPS